MNLFGPKPMRISACILLHLFVLLVQAVHAQEETNIDTISLAQSKAYSTDFITANKLLTEYNQHQRTVDGFRLHAQVLYWMNDFNAAVDRYEEAIHSFPAALPLQLDYARVLFALNKLNRCKQVLSGYLPKDSANAEANIMAAYIDLWSGDILSAKTRSSYILQLYPGNPESIYIRNQLAEFTAPYIQLRYSTLSDDQPLRGAVYHLEVGQYRSWLFNPSLIFKAYNYHATDSAYQSGWLQAANKFQLGIITSLLIGGGIFQQSSRNYYTFNGSLSQKFVNHFTLQAGLEKRPYQYTIASLHRPLFETVSSFSLNYNKKDKWLARAAYERQHFDDGNNVNTLFGWIMIPVISTDNFSISSGYAFSYANAAANNFVPHKSLGEIMNGTPVDSQVPGVYDPYFTPRNQVIHSVIASANLKLGKAVSFGSKISFGAFATADNPVLILEKKGPQYQITRSYYKQQYHPLTGSAVMHWSLSDRLALDADYTYERLFFYTSNRASIQLKYRFIK